MLNPSSRALACPVSADYSLVAGDRILPFLFELDAAESVLSPAPGQNQRFCYIVTALGENTALYADLSHFLLGICPLVTADEIENITVEIDGVQQEVVFGENVQLRTAESPDPPTGCTGLKFNFGLNKVTGVMRVCFELTTAYAVSPVTVCVTGGQQTQNGLTICGPSCAAGEICRTTVSQLVSVCVPVTVTPWARAGEVSAVCCGGASVTPGTTVCPGDTGGGCSFTVTRSLCLTIPLSFGANAVVGAANHTCLGVSDEDLCENCGDAAG